MNRLGYFLLNIAVALYLFANGILGFSNGGEFHKMAGAIFSGNIVNIVTIILSVCAIAAGALMLLSIFKIEIPITDLLLLVFIIVWLVFIVIVDIVYPIKHNMKFLEYLLQLSAHLMVLGAIASLTKRFGS